MLKKIIVISSILILASCSGPKDKIKQQYNCISHSTAKISKERLHKLTFESALSQQDLYALSELGKEFVETSVRKISIIPNVKNKNNLLLAIKAAKKVREIFVENGVSEGIAEIREPNIDEKSSKNYIEIKSYIYDVVLPNDDKWQYDIGDIDTTKETPNFGVSTSYNLGLMIANPRDLIDPAEMGKTDAKSAVANVRKVLGGATAGGSASTSGGSNGSSSSSGSTSSK